MKVVYRNFDVHWNSTNGVENMFWDEQDRLKAIYMIKPGTYQYYAYDDKGERIIKYNLKEGAKLYQNGALVDGGNMALNSYKIYPNPYIVVNSEGKYTKHYFTGSQRIARVVY